jgi:hypothetical protein
MVINNFLYNYLLVKSARPGKRVALLESEIAYLCQKSRQVFLSQPVLLELEAPIKVCGKNQQQSTNKCTCPKKEIIQVKQNTDFKIKKSRAKINETKSLK